MGSIVVFGFTSSYYKTMTEDSEIFEVHDEGATMVLNEKTGGQKQSKLARFDLVPPAVMNELAELYGHGVKFYSARNWEKGYDWGLSYAAVERHMKAFWGGEEFDKESGIHHTVCAMWHMVALTHFQTFEKYQELDDRPEVLDTTTGSEPAEVPQEQQEKRVQVPGQNTVFGKTYGAKN